MPIKTKRWNDAIAPDDGFRVLVSRYRPRGVAKDQETWDEWWPALGPSRPLHAAFYGKAEGGGPAAGPLGFEEYGDRYLEEMRGQVFRIRALADRSASGETITLLCSSACSDEARCHRSLLKKSIDAAAAGRR